jgi:flavorubredoxin
MLQYKGSPKSGTVSYDLIAVGAPTHHQTSSEPVNTFLRTLEHLDLNNKYGFAFDTRKDSFFAGSATKYTEKELRKLGLNIIKPYSPGIIYTSSKKEENDKEARRASAKIKQEEEEKSWIISWSQTCINRNKKVLEE